MIVPIDALEVTSVVDVDAGLHTASGSPQPQPSTSTSGRRVASMSVLCLAALAMTGGLGHTTEQCIPPAQVHREDADRCARTSAREHQLELRLFTYRSFRWTSDIVLQYASNNNRRGTWFRRSMQLCFSRLAWRIKANHGSDDPTTLQLNFL